MSGGAGDRCLAGYTSWTDTWSHQEDSRPAPKADPPPSPGHLPKSPPGTEKQNLDRPALCPSLVLPLQDPFQAPLLLPLGSPREAPGFASQS